MDSEDLPYGFDLVSATIYMYMSPTSAGKGSLNLTAVTLPHHVRSHANPGTFDLRRCGLKIHLYESALQQGSQIETRYCNTKQSAKLWRILSISLL